MIRSYMGIDLGTSSAKVVLRNENGETQKSKAVYDEISPDGWINAVIKAVSALDTKNVVAIGLSSQVGTYIVNDRDVISWNDKIGYDELEETKKIHNEKTFFNEISMPHPDIVSYPVPRLRYIRKKYGDCAKVRQPKDMLMKKLTGISVTDKYSWRGLCNMNTGKYSSMFLSEAGNPRLPKLMEHTESLPLTDKMSELLKMPAGIPVFVGCNDFFASLAGMGIFEAGEMFDITGTSEHLGIIIKSPVEKTPMVSGPYFSNFVHYGVTASSGASLDFGMKNFGYENLPMDNEFIKKAPVFTPYLNGERSPIFDGDARGTFFGINSECTKAHLAYSVLEGVAFSIMHIYEGLGAPKAKRLTISGGAAQNRLLNYLKAELLGISAVILCQSDTSALGAAMIAAVGNGEYPDLKAASEEFCSIKETIMPDGKLRDILKERFKVYKELYPNLKNVYKILKEMQR